MQEKVTREGNSYKNLNIIHETIQLTMRIDSKRQGAAVPSRPEEARQPPVIDRNHSFHEE